MKTLAKSLYPLQVDREPFSCKLSEQISQLPKWEQWVYNRGYDVAGDVCGQNNPALPTVPDSGKNLLNLP